MAITLTETGRRSDARTEPWPWTVNMEGKGVWFDTPTEALSYAYRHYKRGARSFDIGCFQLNFKWHGDAFASIEEMFDPLKNARYAAGFLSDLHAELGNWSKAAGAYHSRTDRHASKYRKKFDKYRLELTKADQTTSAVVPARLDQTPKANGYPLLQTGRTGSVGSLVPLHQQSRPLFAGMERSP